jgi:hypothetical protein
MRRDKMLNKGKFLLIALIALIVVGSVLPVLANTNEENDISNH